MPEDPLNPQRPHEPPFQFSLVTLLALQAGCAVFLVLLAALRIWAVLIAFLATVVFAFRVLRRTADPLQQTAFDLLAGAVMPMLCLLYDPGVFLQNSPMRVLAWLAILYQILLLAVWQWIRHRAGLAGAFFAGGFMVGVAIALVVGVVLAPLTIIGVVVLVPIALLGFAPVLTAVAFVRNLFRALRTSEQSHATWLRAGLVLAGILAAIMGPVAVNSAFGQQLDSILRPLPTGPESDPLFFHQFLNSLR